MQKLTDALGISSTDVANEIVRKCTAHIEAFKTYQAADEKAATDKMLSDTGRQRKRDELAAGWRERREADRRELVSLVGMLREAETKPIDLDKLARGSSIISAMGDALNIEVLRTIAADAQGSGQATLNALEGFAESVLGTGRATAQVAFGRYMYDQTAFSEAMRALELSKTRDTSGMLLGVAVGAAVDGLARVVLKSHELPGDETGKVSVTTTDHHRYF